MQTLYVNVSEGTITTTEPEGVTLIESNFPDGTKATVVLPLLVQVLEQAKLGLVGATTPDVAFKLNFGSE